MHQVEDETMTPSDIHTVIEPPPKSKRPRRVSFNNDEAEIVATLTPSSSMCEEEQKDIWYSKAELRELKDSAKKLCKQVLSKQQPPDDEHNCIRGMERYYSAERVRHKGLAIRVILKAQGRFAPCSAQVAYVSRKCTAQAQEAARMEGVKDFLEAYSPSDITTSSSTCPPPPPPPPPPERQCHKRKSEEEPPCRNVRTAVSPSPDSETDSTTEVASNENGLTAR